MNYKLNLDIDNTDYYYRISKNKNNHIVQQRVDRPQYLKEDAIFKSTDMSAADNMISEINLDSIIAKKQIKDKITQALTYLTPREERVLRMRFGVSMNTDHTLEEVGLQFSVTRTRIGQIEAKALRKLSYYCKDFKELLEVA
jgi:RNA polymerase sigma factor (sigma-70 family)